MTSINHSGHEAVAVLITEWSTLSGWFNSSRASAVVPVAGSHVAGATWAYCVGGCRLAMCVSVRPVGRVSISPSVAMGSREHLIAIHSRYTAAYTIANTTALASRASGGLPVPTWVVLCDVEMYAFSGGAAEVAEVHCFR